MKTSVILAHPTPGSFNHAIAETSVAVLLQNGHSVSFHDLHAEGFDPVLPSAEIASGASLSPSIAAYCRELSEADGIVIVHPNWWGQPPAILKGWVDRVLRPGVAYNFLDGDDGEGVPVGLLKAARAVVFNTSNTPLPRELAEFGDPLDLIWRRCIFGLCGVRDVRREMFGVVVTSTKEQREHWLSTVRDIVGRSYPAGGSIMAIRTAPTSIDEYIAASPSEVRPILRKIRRTIGTAAPEAQELISYRMPAFRLHGILLYFAAFKNHIGVYPPVTGDATLQKALSPYAGPKGNLKFPLDQPIPYALIKRVMLLRVKQDSARAAAKGRKRAERRK